MSRITELQNDVDSLEKSLQYTDKRLDQLEKMIYDKTAEIYNNMEKVSLYKQIEDLKKENGELKVEIASRSKK